MKYVKCWGLKECGELEMGFMNRSWKHKGSYEGARKILVSSTRNAAEDRRMLAHYLFTLDLSSIHLNLDRWEHQLHIVVYIYIFMYTLFCICRFKYWAKLIKSNRVFLV